MSGALRLFFLGPALLATIVFPFSLFPSSLSSFLSCPSLTSSSIAFSCLEPASSHDWLLPASLIDKPHTRAPKVEIASTVIPALSCPVLYLILYELLAWLSPWPSASNSNRQSKSRI
ncbi:hypothetical protein V8C26DRAFT_111992 [Trichoderma gracile]